MLEFAENEGLNVINVNQGYSGCSVCVINDSAIITDDESIFTAAQNFLNDVLLIQKGSIRLNGYNYGFIGGCCGKISKNKLSTQDFRQEFTGGVCVHVYACVCAKLLQLYPCGLCDHVDCSPSDSSIHGILQARMLEWVAIPFSRGSSRPRDRTRVSYISCIGRWILYLLSHLG